MIPSTATFYLTLIDVLKLKQHF